MTGTTAGSPPPVSRPPSAVTMLETSSSTPTQPLAVPGHPPSESLLTSSSITSHDTFMTALTSSQSPSPTASKLSATAPHSLRKSISVDSFIKHRRSPDLSEPGPSSGGHPRDYSRESFLPGAANNIELEDWNLTPRYTATNGQRPPSSASRSLACRILGRARGHSLGSHSISDYDDPFLDDSDHERTADMAHLPVVSSHRSHSASSSAVNGFGKGKAKARPGDFLLLPPRTPTLSNASSASSLSSIANGAPFTDGIPPVPPIPHLHQRRPNVPEPLVMPHRTRSSSLSAKNSAHHSGSSDALFSIAVVGAPGCGKTTVIRKGLKAWGVSDESICTVATPKGRLRYATRTINAPRDDEKVAHVVELDSDVLCLESPGGAWPEELPRIDGVLVCYDASDPVSFVRVPDLLACYHALHLSAVAIACKCDLEKKVLPHHASERAAPYNVGLVEVTCVTDIGRRKMRHCFHWIIRAVEKLKRGDIPPGSPYRNPASPEALNAPWSEGYGYPEVRSGSARSRGSTPSASSPSLATKFRDHPFATAVHRPASPSPGTSTPTPRSPAVPTPPTRVKSTNDLISEVERSRQEMRRESLDSRRGVLGRTASTGSLRETLLSNEKDDYGSLKRYSSGETKKSRNSDPPPMVWATPEELLDKLFFLAVSGDDPTFIKYFFLTYRRFATPRSILLGMQKRVRQLNQDHSDVLLGSYAQMRICDLLEGWIEDYPTDFATPGTYGAINALLKQISSNLCTLHYGSDILPFLDELPHLQDVETSWSLHEDFRDDSDEEGAELLDDEEDEATQRSVRSVKRDPFSSATALAVANPTFVVFNPKLSTRERKGSLPMSTKSIASPLSTTLSGSSENSSKGSGALLNKRNSPRELVRLAQTLATYDPMDIAQQITKIQSEIFLAIEPRQWLRYTMGDAKSYPGEPITASANFYNQLANWVSSLILAHDKVRLRERQVERFIDLAGKLRSLNNYVGLRAVKTGINNATYPNDEIMTMLRDNKIKLYQQFLGWEILLNSIHNHRAYRMAIRHTTGPGIPDMEVHTFDMVRANETNVDWKDDDPSKIHWGKFTLMARMIIMLQSLQDKIRSSGGYEFPERKWIREMLNNDVMDVETMRSRVFPPPDDAEPIFPLSQQSIESPSAARTEAARFKRLFFW